MIYSDLPRLAEIPTPSDFSSHSFLHQLGYVLEHGGRHVRVVVMDNHECFGCAYHPLARYMFVVLLLFSEPLMTLRTPNFRKHHT